MPETTNFLRFSSCYYAFHVSSFAELSKWMSIERCLDLLIDVKPGDDRIGLLVAVGLLNTSEQSGYCKIPQTLNVQVCQDSGSAQVFF